MTTTVLSAVDAFTVDQEVSLATAIEGWAVLRTLPQESTPELWTADLATAIAVVGWPPPASLLDSPARLVQLGSAGFDDYLGHGLESNAGLHLCTARGVMSEPVAEHAIALMLSLVRQLPLHGRDIAEGRWKRADADQYREIAGTTACIVGLGDIGTAIARRCRALGQRVVGVKQRPVPVDWCDEVVGLSDLHAALASADHVFLSVAGGPTTTGLIGHAELEQMKSSAYLYNLSRGSTLDEGALLDALDAGRLAGAGLDVLAEEPPPSTSRVWSTRNLLLTPHVGGLSALMTGRLVDLAINNLIRLRDGRDLLNVVDLSHGAPR